MSELATVFVEAAVNDLQVSAFAIMPPIFWFLGTALAIYLIIRIRPPIKAMSVFVGLSYVLVYAAFQAVLPII